MKKFCSWLLPILFSLLFIAYMPSFASFLFLLLAVATLPIEKINTYFNNLIPGRSIRVIAFVAVFVLGCNVLPTSNISVSDTETAEEVSLEEDIIDEPEIEPVKEVTPEPVEQTTSEAPEVDNNTITHSNNYTESTSVVEDTVYITPTGKKYHYSASCAGKNAMPRLLSDASATYGPCKKCAQ